MTTRERLLAVLRYREYDRLPILHFGFLGATLAKWAAEGHLDLTALEPIGDATPGEERLTAALGFDDNYHRVFAPNCGLLPGFASRVLEITPEGFRKVLTGDGAIVLESDDNQSISPHVDHLLRSRADWDRDFRDRLRFAPERVGNTPVNCGGQLRPFAAGGREYLQRADRPTHILLHCGSLYGFLRNMMGVEGLSYLLVDDEPLLDEMIETVGELSFRCAEAALASGVPFDLGHFWEDIAFKNGPLVNPRVYREKVGPHYRRVADLLHRHGIELISLDCDGMVDALVPVWLDNGINVMFPIEVGTWNASLEPWRRRYGRQVLGVGGMNKKVFAHDFAAIDAEVDRLRRLVDLGGFVPCVDHRIAADAEWDNVRYYCERMRAVFG